MERPTLEFAPNTKRMRVGLSHKFDKRGITEIWITFRALKHGNEIVSRGYLFDSPDGTGRSHTISEAQGQLNHQSFVKEIDQSIKCLSYWRKAAERLWIAKFGDVKQKADSKPIAESEGNGRTRARSELSRSASESQPLTLSNTKDNGDDSESEGSYDLKNQDIDIHEFFRRAGLIHNNLKKRREEALLEVMEQLMALR